MSGDRDCHYGTLDLGGGIEHCIQCQLDAANEKIAHLERLREASIAHEKRLVGRLRWMAEACKARKVDEQWPALAPLIDAQLFGVSEDSGDSGALRQTRAAFERLNAVTEAKRRIDAVIDALDKEPCAVCGREVAPTPKAPPLLINMSDDLCYRRAEAALGTGGAWSAALECEAANARRKMRDGKD